MPDPLLVLDKVSTGYQSADGGSCQILSDVQLMVRGGARIGVLGVNGAGKSTLIKTLAGQLPALAGERRASKGLAIGSFAQPPLAIDRKSVGVGKSVSVRVDLGGR